MSRVKPYRALVGRPDGLLMFRMAWNTWKMSAWASTTYRLGFVLPAAMEVTTRERGSALGSGPPESALGHFRAGGGGGDPGYGGLPVSPLRVRGRETRGPSGLWGANGGTTSLG